MARDDDDEEISNETLEEVDCLNAFHAVYHELQLIKSVRKAKKFPKHKPDFAKNALFYETQPKMYLLLGDIHPHPEHRASYRPTSYQTALVRDQEVRKATYRR